MSLELCVYSMLSLTVRGILERRRRMRDGYLKNGIHVAGLVMIDEEASGGLVKSRQADPRRRAVLDYPSPII